MEIEKLIGFQLLELNEDYILIKKENKEYKVFIERDEGDCCGYNEIETKLFYEKGNKRNPIITNITILHDEIYNAECTGNKSILTFFGEDKKIAQIESLSSSGSGWCYGATVRLKCDLLKLDEILSEY